MHLYDSTIPSGNAYKVRLILAQLGIRYQTTELDVLAIPSEAHSAAFLAKSPQGQIPVLELDDGRVLPESGAILFYLAEGTPLLAQDRFERAQTLRWMFFEQFSHQPYMARLESHTYRSQHEALRPDAVARLRVGAQAALDAMEQHLEGHAYFAADQYGIADIALFAYTQHADHIGLRTGSAVKAWFTRVRGQPGHVPIKRGALPKRPEHRWA